MFSIIGYLTFLEIAISNSIDNIMEHSLEFFILTLYVYEINFVEVWNFSFYQMLGLDVLSIRCPFLFVITEFLFNNLNVNKINKILILLTFIIIRTKEYQINTIDNYLSKNIIIELTYYMFLQHMQILLRVWLHMQLFIVQFKFLSFWLNPLSINVLCLIQPIVLL